MKSMLHKFQEWAAKPSIMVIIAFSCFVIITMDGWRSWHKGDDPFSWDVMNYYSYLPANFSDKNGFEFAGIHKEYLPIYPGDSLHIPKTTYGMCVFYAPFYALGYKVAINQHDPRDGFSEPFATCLHWGMILYGLLALLILRNFLIKHFSEKVTTITLVIIFLDTLLFYYAVAMPEIAHSALFFLFASFLLCSYHWHKQPGIKTSVLLGLIIGLISLIRPTDLMVIFIFIFWPGESKFNFKERVTYFLSKWKYVLVMIMFAFLVWLPQMLFWKARTGSLLYFSYPGEGFFWSDPQIINVLFSYRKGLLLYTPLIGLALIGFFFMKDRSSGFRNILAFVFLLNLYVISCWWDWFFGGCFGARAFVQHFAYLSVPLAAFIAFVFERSTWAYTGLLRLATVVVVAFGISLNLTQTYQYSNNMIHFNAMTKKTYWMVFGKFKFSTKENEAGAWWGTLKEVDYDKLRSGEDRDQ